MKELSVEEKAKAYDGLIERLKDLKFAYRFSPLSDTIEEKFPELAEPEDERIRKELLNYLYDVHDDDEERARWIAWLENQGEQKPVFEMKTPEESLGIDSETYSKIVDECIYGEQKPAWSEEDEKFFKTALWHISYSISNGKSTDINCDTTDWLKALKDRVQPQPLKEWSENDERHVNSLLKRLEGLCRNEFERTRFAINEDEDWLKSLRPQNIWKPSDKQLDALHDAAVYVDKSMFPHPKGILMKLYKQLKKLREEDV